MAQFPERITVRIDLDIRLSVWQAIKLRLAGGQYLRGYMQSMLEQSVGPFSQLNMDISEDEDDDGRL